MTDIDPILEEVTPEAPVEIPAGEEMVATPVVEEETTTSPEEMPA